MEAVNEAMEDRRKQERSSSDEYEASIERIETSKQLTRHGLRWVDWPHATQEHGGIQECIDPRQVLELNVAEHAKR